MFAQFSLNYIFIPRFTQTSIKRSKLAFEARITEIEAELKAAEESEQRWLSEDAPRPSVTTDDDDDTEDKTGIDASNESVATAKTPQSTNSGDNPTRPADKYRWNRRPTAGDSHTVIGEVQPHDQKIVQTHGECFGRAHVIVSKHFVIIQCVCVCDRIYFV